MRKRMAFVLGIASVLGLAVFSQTGKLLILPGQDPVVGHVSNGYFVGCHGNKVLLSKIPKLKLVDTRLGCGGASVDDALSSDGDAAGATDSEAAEEYAVKQEKQKIDKILAAYAKAHPGGD